MRRRVLIVGLCFVMLYPRTGSGTKRFEREKWIRGRLCLRGGADEVAGSGHGAGNDGRNVLRNTWVITESVIRAKVCRVRRQYSQAARSRETRARSAVWLADRTQPMVESEVAVLRGLAGGSHGSRGGTSLRFAGGTAGASGRQGSGVHRLPGEDADAADHRRVLDCYTRFRGCGFRWNRS